MTVKSNSFLFKNLNIPFKKKISQLEKSRKSEGVETWTFDRKSPHQTKPNKSKKYCQFNSQKTNVFNYTNL